MGLLNVGTTAIVAVHQKRDRAKVRFQNIGNTILYFRKGTGVPSSSNFDFSIRGQGEGEANEEFVDIYSIAQYNVVSSGANGQVAILETFFVK